MLKMNQKKQFIRNILAAFLAQGVSLIISILMSLVVPRFLGIVEYGYWQLFVFYVGYVGFFHFGFIDGMYLRLGGMEYQELDFNKIGTEFRIFLMVEIIIAIIIAVTGYLVIHEPERKIIVILVAAYMIINNLTLFFGYIFQAVNNTKVFSFSIIIDKIFVLLFTVVLLLGQSDNFIFFILAYSLSKGIALVYCMIKGKKIMFSEVYNVKNVLYDILVNINIGIKLMFANIVSMLILGMGRIVIDNVWGIEAFGKISLSLTLTNFFLLFIQQVSMVLFPALRRVSENKLGELYKKLRTVLGIVLPMVLVGYIPMKIILSIWLPQYAESLRYLALLLPICIFDGKMQMLYNTYLKVLRKEKSLLYINSLTLLFSALLAVVSGFLMHNLLYVIMSMLISIALRSIVAEIYLAGQMDVKIENTLFLELIFVALAVVVSWNCSDIFSFLFTLIAYIIYLIIERKKLRQCFSWVSKRNL